MPLPAHFTAALASATASSFIAQVNTNVEWQYTPATPLLRNNRPCVNSKAQRPICRYCLVSRLDSGSPGEILNHPPQDFRQVS